MRKILICLTRPNTELITSLVVSNPIIAGALEGTAEGHRHRQNGLVLAIDLARFGDPQAFRSEVDRVIAALKALSKAPGAHELRGVAARFGLATFPSAL